MCIFDQHKHTKTASSKIFFKRTTGHSHTSQDSYKQTRLNTNCCLSKVNALHKTMTHCKPFQGRASRKAGLVKNILRLRENDWGKCACKQTKHPGYSKSARNNCVMIFVPVSGTRIHLWDLVKGPAARTVFYVIDSTGLSQKYAPFVELLPVRSILLFLIQS